MKLFVCVNQVPDTETKVKVGQDGKTIDRSEINLILNPYDEFAVEAALQLKDKTGAEVTYVSVGGDSTKKSSGKLSRWAATGEFYQKSERATIHIPWHP